MDGRTGRDGRAWVVGDDTTVAGFRLAGLQGRVAASDTDARAALDDLRARGAALVLLTEQLCDALGGLEALALGAVQPIVVVIPSAALPRVALLPGVRRARAVQRALGVPAEGRS